MAISIFCLIYNRNNIVPHKQKIEYSNIFFLCLLLKVNFSKRIFEDKKLTFSAEQMENCDANRLVENIVTMSDTKIPT